MSATVVSLPKPRKLPPDGVRLGYDFGRWCAELFRGKRFTRRHSYGRRCDAETAVDAWTGHGCRLLPPSPVAAERGAQ